MIFEKYKTRGAYHYDWYKNNTFGYKDCVDECIEFCKGSTLDVGSGDGLVMDLLDKKGIKVNGIENDPIGIGLSPEHLWEETWLEDINSACIDGEWEYMVCLNVIEHLENSGAVRDIFKDYITKAAIIITDIPQGDLPPEHYHEYTPHELKQMFQEFKVVPFTIGENFHGIKVYK